MYILHTHEQDTDIQYIHTHVLKHSKKRMSDTMYNHTYLMSDKTLEEENVRYNVHHIHIGMSEK